MIEMMLDLDLEGKKVLDMGSGTGILAIFAAMKNAATVTAIDIDEWAYHNAAENCELNNIKLAEILQGDSSLLQGRSFDIILANINRNILLADIATYSKCLSAGGMLQISGFYESDFPDIEAVAEKNGLTQVKKLQKGKWVAALFQIFNLPVCPR
jgi:ribosomal protein L11 methyltransferase